jgi:hypothetical protein
VLSGRRGIDSRTRWKLCDNLHSVSNGNICFQTLIKSDLISRTC